MPIGCSSSSMSIQVGCLKSKFSGLKISRSGFVSCGKQLAQFISSTFKTKINTHPPPQKNPTLLHILVIASLCILPHCRISLFFPSVYTDHETLAKHSAFEKIGPILRGTELCWMGSKLRLKQPSSATKMFEAVSPLQLCQLLWAARASPGFS